jgi:hypothetical protein
MRGKKSPIRVDPSEEAGEAEGRESETPGDSREALMGIAASNSDEDKAPLSDLSGDG